MAKALKLDVVAEGIESINQLRQLRTLGCEFGQGFFFSRPLPVGEIDRLFDESHRWQHLVPSGGFGSTHSYSELLEFDLAQ